MIIVLDFDHTLFDTNRMRVLIGREPHESFTRLELEQIPQEVVAACVYPDARAFLVWAKAQEKLALILITTGVIPFQKAKVERSGLGAFFKEVVWKTRKFH